MINTTIQSIDTTGRDVLANPELRSRVERAARVLESELEIVKAFPIESRWRIVHQPGAEPRVELDLTGWGTGVRDWLFDPQQFRDDTHILRALRGPISAFGSAVSFVLRDDLERIQHNLKKLATVTTSASEE
jgi:hypothetical protein